MARKPRTSVVLETARQRLVALKSIALAPNFGGNSNATGFPRESFELRSALLLTARGWLPNAVHDQQ